MILKRIVKSILEPSSSIYKFLSYFSNYNKKRYLPKKIRGFDNILENLSKSESTVKFVQVGSNDGVSGDPLYQYINTYNWNGVLIEPIPFLFEKLKANYLNKINNLVFLNIAISAEDVAIKTMYSIDEKNRGVLPDWYFQLGSFYKDVLYHHQIPDIDSYIKLIEVPVSTIQKIINSHMKGNIHLLHIDTEGYDLEILKTLDFNITIPKVVITEYINLNENDRRKMSKLLKSNGYIIYRCNQDFISLHHSVHNLYFKGTFKHPFWE